MPHVDQWRATSFHEAGHAVFALKVCGFEVWYVSADESCTAIRMSAWDVWAECWRLAKLTLAGSFAEQLEIRGEILPETLEEVLDAYEIKSWEFEEGRSDTSALVKHLKAMDGNLEENYAIVVEDTESEVRRLWPAVKAVAETLEQRGHLEGEEVAKLIALQHPPEEK